MISPPCIASIVIPVYRDAARARDAVNSILKQEIPTDTSLDVVIVDDGSGDGTLELLAQIVDPRVRLLQLPENVGRSAARNAGASFARGSIVIFMDCDCHAAGNHFIEAHLQALQDAVVSIGHVSGDGTMSFWDSYQRDASARRHRQHGAGILYAGSSQNLAVRRSAFEVVGGFDTAYRHYGFEDRDLQIRLSRVGGITWTCGATVRHMDVLSLATVSRKMMEAGEFTSARFAQDHPGAYRALGYPKLDARQHFWLRLPAMLARAFRKPLARFGDTFLDSGMVPYSIKRTYVRAVTAISYLAGTSALQQK